MKYSIKRQMMTVFVGLILFMIVVFMIVNGSFLEKYYISNKKSEFIKAYTMVQEGVENGTIDSETPEKDLGRFTEKIQKQGGDYLFAVKGNQGRLNKAFEEKFPLKELNNPEHDSYAMSEKSHGRGRRRWKDYRGNVQGAVS